MKNKISKKLRKTKSDRVYKAILKKVLKLIKEIDAKYKRRVEK